MKNKYLHLAEKLMPEAFNEVTCMRTILEDQTEGEKTELAHKTAASNLENTTVELTFECFSPVDLAAWLYCHKNCQITNPETILSANLQEILTRIQTPLIIKNLLQQIAQNNEEFFIIAILIWHKIIEEKKTQDQRRQS